MRTDLKLRGLLHFLVLATLSQGSAAAEESEQANELWHEYPHHISFILGATVENGKIEDEEGATFGVDYEYRLNELIGIGAVFERAFGSLDATTALAVVDLHVWRQLAIQTGPGFERADGENEFVYRVGVLYEFERHRFTVSPQLHLDVTDDHESLVLGVAFGFGF